MEAHRCFGLGCKRDLNSCAAANVAALDRELLAAFDGDMGNDATSALPPTAPCFSGAALQWLVKGSNAFSRSASLHAAN